MQLSVFSCQQALIDPYDPEHYFVFTSLENGSHALDAFGIAAGLTRFSRSVPPAVILETLFFRPASHDHLNRRNLHVCKAGSVPGI